MKVYLDYIGATPLAPEAREAMLPVLSDDFGNAQSRHALGQKPKEALAHARAAVARMIGASPEEIFFTASGSEANNWAIRGSTRGKRGHLITSAVEHYSVAHPFQSLQKEGWEVSVLPVDREGRVDPRNIEGALRPDTILASLQHASSEMGSIQPIEQIAPVLRSRGVRFHVDAVASVGVIPVDLERLGIDLLTLAAPTFYGPKGAAALTVRRGVRILPLIEGGIQEEGRRAGTENVAAIAGMGAAAEVAIERLSADGERIAALRDRLLDGLAERTPLVHVTGSREHRLPTIASVCVEYVEAEALIKSLERRGIIAASGSSCASHAQKISPVLTAMGFPPNIAAGGVVFSLGRGTDDAQVDYVLEVFPEEVAQLRRLSPIYAAGGGLR